MSDATRCRNASFIDFVRDHAYRQPEATAFTYLGDNRAAKDELTFFQVDCRARAVAAALLERADPGDRVLIAHRDPLDFIQSFLGALYAGLVAVPACTDRTPSLIARNYGVIVDSSPRIVMATREYWDGIGGQCRRQDNPIPRMDLLLPDDIDLARADDWRDPNAKGNDLAFLQYTSGSTEEPKGVMVSHANILANEQMITKAFGHSRSTVVVGWLPLFHDMGLIGHVLQPLYVGCRSILMCPSTFLKRPLRWLQAVSDFQATTTGAPNFAYERCVARIAPEDRHALDLSSLEIAYNGSERVHSGTLQRFYEYFVDCGFRRRAFLPCFGLAEATLFVAAIDRDAEPSHVSLSSTALTRNEAVETAAESDDVVMSVSCGTPPTGCEVVIVDVDRRTPLAERQVGEIWVSGPHVAQGYFNQSEISKETFAAMLADGKGPFLRTGDLGFAMNGQLHVTGRIKDVVKLFGRNYHPQDLERTSECAHEKLQPEGACAFSIEVGNEEKLVIVQSLEKTAGQGEHLEIVQAIRQAIAEQYVLPVFAICLVRAGRLPRTSSGKKQRSRCRQMFVAGELSPVHSWSLHDLSRAIQ